MKYRKVFILGTVGSGKSWLGERISERIGAEHVDLDELYWDGKYGKKRKSSERERMLKGILKKKSWIIEGVYTNWTHEAMKKADVVILLDFPFYVLAPRIARRFFLKKHGKGNGIKDLARLMRYAYVYKKTRHSPCGFYAENKLIEKYRLNSVVLDSGGKIRDFLAEIR